MDGLFARGGAVALLTIWRCTAGWRAGGRVGRGGGSDACASRHGRASPRDAERVRLDSISSADARDRGRAGDVGERR